jgi:outer membrane protein assembly factor BamE (lipoprotein component of BamABCDE complex)
MGAEEDVVTGKKERGKYVANAAFWIHPGLSDEGVVKFLGKPDLIDSKDGLIYYYRFSLAGGENAENGRQGIAEISFDKERMVTNVKVFEFKKIQDSGDFHNSKNNSD